MVNELYQRLPSNYADYEERAAKRKRMREYRKEKELTHVQMLKDSLIRANAEKWIRKNIHESN